MADQPQAVLVVDVQVGTIDPDSSVDKAVLQNIGGLLDRARKSGVPVVYMQHHGLDEGHPLVPGNPQFDIHPAVAPKDGETVVRKHSSDSFLRTELDDVLKSHRAGNIAVVGCATNFCVDTTCRSALSHGYDVTLASDAHTTDWGGTMSIEDTITYHNQILEGISIDGASIRVVPAAEILA